MYRVVWLGGLFDLPKSKCFDTPEEALKYADKKGGYVEKFNPKTGYYNRFSR